MQSSWLPFDWELGFDEDEQNENAFYSSSPKISSTTSSSHSPFSSPPAKRSKNVTCTRRDSLVAKSMGELRFFPRQREALAFLAEQRRLFSDMRVFSVEDTKIGNGARKYMVSSVSRFWLWYAKRPPESRHFYELITEEERCRLFFDLEYQKEANPDVEEKNCMTHFFETLGAVLKEELAIDVDCSKNSIVLDSSTACKFSQHVILHLPDGRLFPSASELRPLIERLSNRLLESPTGRLKVLDSDKETTICDLSVYSRNRNFRLFLSSKAEKAIPFLLAESCNFYGGRVAKQEEIFIDSLCVPPGWQKADVISLASLHPSSQPLLSSGFSRSQLARSDGGGQSPWPFLDDFMLSLVSRWRSEGDHFRKWSVEKNDEGEPIAITYYPSRSRFCYNIGREHKRNGTYWRVNLFRFEYSQRCFDVDCRGSHNLFPLPDRIKIKLKKLLLPDESKSGEENELAAASFGSKLPLVNWTFLQNSSL